MASRTTSDDDAKDGDPDLEKDFKPQLPSINERLGQSKNYFMHTIYSESYKQTCQATLLGVWGTRLGQTPNYVLTNPHPFAQSLY